MRFLFALFLLCCTVLASPLPSPARPRLGAPLKLDTGALAAPKNNAYDADRARMTFQSTKKEQNYDPNTGTKNEMTPSLLKPPMVGDPRKDPVGEGLPGSGGSTPGPNTVASQNMPLAQVPPQRSQFNAPTSNSFAPSQSGVQPPNVPGTPTVTSPQK